MYKYLPNTLVGWVVGSASRMRLFESATPAQLAEGVVAAFRAVSDYDVDLIQTPTLVKRYRSGCS